MSYNKNILYVSLAPLGILTLLANFVFGEPSSNKPEEITVQEKVVDITTPTAKQSIKPSYVSTSLPPKPQIQATHILKIGKFCPSGYIQSGGYCNPQSGAKYAIHKIGKMCPSCFRPFMDYCIANCNDVKLTIPKTGSSCPSGFRPLYNYCISNN